ncbi:MAG: NifB/NifX family molybdenum-iron cluster-binding protein [Bacteroidales bacterium]
MIIAIPASKDKIDALTDERFGRCPFFCLYNTRTGNHIFKKNIIKDASDGVGLRAAEFLANNGVDEVYAMEVGPKAQGVLKRLKIKINPVDSGQTVAKIINMLNHKN